MRRFAILFLVSCILFGCTAALAAGPEETPAGAAELTAAAEIVCSGGDGSVLADGDETTYTTIPAGGSVTITSEVEIASLYVIFDRIYGEWALSDGTASAVCGENDYLHEYVDVAERLGYAPKSLTLTFAGGACSLSEIHVFGAGETPSWVQVWEPPCEEADLLLFSTHIDDEHLFFAGLLPYYAVARGYDVQVAYFTDPFTYHDRTHEQLNGLWTVGIRHYPVSGEFIDMRSYSAAQAYEHQKSHGFEREDMVRFQVELLRRFRPQVAVGHDINGEYVHGQHIINCETLMEGLDLAADPSYDPASAEKYGVWDTPKAYIHLWPENPIVMDWDMPLEVFGGKTAFQVSQDGFRCQTSQLPYWPSGWIFGTNGATFTKATQIELYSPCKYGLYRTTVGLDEAGGDMFEHISQSYAEIREAEEKRLLEEAERLEAEIRRQEEEKEKEKKRQEEERRAAQEALRQEIPPVEAESRAEVEASPDVSAGPGAVTIWAAAVTAAAALLLFLRIRAMNKKTKK